MTGSAPAKRPRALTRNSPCPKHPWHNLRYCPEFKADVQRIRDTAAAKFREEASKAQSHEELASAANRAIKDAFNAERGALAGVDVPAEDPEDGPVTPT